MKKFMCLAFTFLLISAKTMYAQDSSFNLRKGIYLENKNVLIPWILRFGEINNYGSPTLRQSKYHRNQTEIVWDSVKVFGRSSHTGIRWPEKIFFEKSAGKFKGNKGIGRLPFNYKTRRFF
jgi:hypothetical protein